MVQILFSCRFRVSSIVYIPEILLDYDHTRFRTFKKYSKLQSNADSWRRDFLFVRNRYCSISISTNQPLNFFSEWCVWTLRPRNDIFFVESFAISAEFFRGIRSVDCLCLAPFPSWIIHKSVRNQLTSSDQFVFFFASGHNRIDVALTLDDNYDVGKTNQPGGWFAQPSALTENDLVRVEWYAESTRVVFSFFSPPLSRSIFPWQTNSVLNYVRTTKPSR